MEPHELEQPAHAALSAFGLDGAVLHFLRHNENAVYRVETPKQGVFALRLHLPRPGVGGGMVTHRQDWLTSELTWLAALAKRSDLPVQRPRRTRDGALLAELPGGGWASALSWLPGAPLRQDGPRAPLYAGLAGELAARLHTFVMGWPEGDVLPRPAYDGSRVRTAMATLEDGVSLGMLTSAQVGRLAAGAARMASLLDREWAVPGAHGLIHADLGLGNLLVEGDTLSPIDFGLCGHGPFAQDVGGLLGTFDTPALRQAMLDGYRNLRPLPPDDAIQAAFLASIYYFMAMHLRNPAVQEWFGRRLPAVLAEYVDPFVRGESFLPALLCTKG